MKSKFCARCREDVPISEFSKSGKSSDGLQSWCRECKRKHELERSHLKGIKRPMNVAKECASFLGVHIAERALSKFFDYIERMPYGNPGYDFICGRGYKIDVKSACTRHSNGKHPHWIFCTKRNHIADYFLCLAFDDRTSLEPQHVWLIPGKDIGYKSGITITDIEKSLTRYRVYEKPLEKITNCCKTLRSGAFA